MVIQPSNPWGKANSLEVQRSDLWVFELDPVIRYIRSNFPWISPLPEDAKPYAKQVQFPEKRIRNKVIYRDSRPYNMPDYDDPLSEIRVDFLYDQPSSTPIAKGAGTLVPNPTGTRSRIYTLLHAWYELARIGRNGLGQNLVGIPPYSPTNQQDLQDLPVTTNPVSLQYSFDLEFHFLRGSMQSMNASIEADEDVRPLVTSSAHRLIGCWCAGVQLNTVTTEGAQLQVVTGIFYADDIQPIEV